jgi:hypothetical protein
MVFLSLSSYTKFNESWFGLWLNAFGMTARYRLVGSQIL